MANFIERKPASFNDLQRAREVTIPSRINAATDRAELHKILKRYNIEPQYLSLFMNKHIVNSEFKMLSDTSAIKFMALLGEVRNG
jgi:hypothetical protein